MTIIFRMMVTRAGAKPVVMISLEDYAAMDETTYLLSTKANKEALLKSIEQVERGEFIEKSMTELEAMEKE